jgi:alkyldihydroxyacetonephosphate synthase
MRVEKPLYGWLDQGERDPLGGKPLAKEMLRQMLGMSELHEIPAKPFAPGSVPEPRLGKAAQRALLEHFGSERFSVDRLERARLSLGQSYPDQIRRRSGDIGHAADAIVRPKSAEECLALLKCAAEFHFCVTPIGGGTNVVGAIGTGADKRPWVIADLTLMNRVIDISTVNQTVEAEAGISLGELEKALSAKGLTLGHFPQSFHGAMLGGSIACNGAGQRSDLYGRLSDNFLTADVAAPKGLWKTEPFRHAAAGPWLGGLVPGAEGMFGLICSAKLRLHKAPETVEDRAWFFPSFEIACETVKGLAQDGHGLAMLRLSDESETQFLSQFRLAMAAHVRASMIQRLALKLKRAPPRPALLIAGFEGKRVDCAQTFSDLNSRLRAAGAVALGRRPGASWRKGRYELPYLRESLLRLGIGVETFETAVAWSDVRALKAGVCGALKEIVATTLSGLPGKAAVMCHLSHSYPEGACLYFTLLFPQNDSPLTQWRVIKSAVMSTVSELGGTVSHHHGVGADHAELAASDKGSLALAAHRALKSAFDPDNVIVSGIGAMLGAAKKAE